MAAPDPAAPAYYAHSARDGSGQVLGPASGAWQLLAEHLRAVGATAASLASPLGQEAEAGLAGVLHDLGKYAGNFQARLRDPSIHGIDHWAAGARAALDCGVAQAAYAIDGHHTGLPDFSSLQRRMHVLDDAAGRLDLTRCGEPVAELLRRFTRDSLATSATEGHGASDLFAAALATRMLFSCLVDADYLDTESHFNPEVAMLRGGVPLEAVRALEALLAHLGRLEHGSALGQARRALLEGCLRAAEGAPGLYTLTAPTGTGKTLASVAFALRHITHRNAGQGEGEPSSLRRVIIVIPYTNIIEQTAAVLRGVFCRVFGDGYVLEHHSAFSPEGHAAGAEDAESEPAQRARLAAENWDAPLVVTTSVQFFESLFASRPARCRKLHNIARSVIIFDEVQTLPTRLLPSLLSAVSLLAREPYGCTALFMTATQPAFAAAGAALPYGWGPAKVAWDAPPLPPRTHLELPEPDVSLGWPEVAARLGEQRQCLCVVNTTGDARTLYRLLPAEGRYHLSSRLCPAHRRRKLAEIREALAQGQLCRLVSTQLIEAGVDVDFPAAFRALGPLDSLIQTAGRCNREGRAKQPGRVVVFRPAEGSLPPGAFRAAAQMSEQFLARHPEAAQQLVDPAFYAAYFAELYAIVGRGAAAADPVFAASERFDFPAAADACRIVDDNTQSVLVAWEGGIELVERLRREKHLPREEWRKLQQFSVNLYQAEFAQARIRGYVTEIIAGVWRWASHYDDGLGACHLEGDDFCL